MGIKLKNGEIVNPPPSGETELTVDANGALQSTGSDGVTAVVGANAATADAPTDAAAFSTLLVAGDAVIATLSGDSNTLDITGLAGNTDGDYEFEGVLNLHGNATQNVVTMQPENLATNANGQFIYGTAITPATGATTLMPIGIPTNTADSQLVFRGKLSSKTGRTRVFTCTGVGINTDASKLMTDSVIMWTDTTTPITKLRINADHGMRSGSFIRVRKCRNLT